MLTINRKVAGEPVNPDAHVKPALASKGLAVLDTVDPDEPVLDRIDLSTSSDHLLTADAKRDYFLVSGDLAGCEIYRPGGCEPPYRLHATPPDTNTRPGIPRAGPSHNNTGRAMAQRKKKKKAHIPHPSYRAPTTDWMAIRHGRISPYITGAG